MSVQPSEFLKPCFVAICAWFMAASQEVGGPPGRAYSAVLAALTVVLLALQPDFGQASLVLFSWCVMYFIAGAPLMLLFGVMGAAVLGGFFAYGASDHFARRIDGFLIADVDPRTQLGYAWNAIQEGGFFGVGVGIPHSLKRAGRAEGKIALASAKASAAGRITRIRTAFGDRPGQPNSSGTSTRRRAAFHHRMRASGNESGAPCRDS